MASKRLIEAAREVVAAADKCQDWNGTHLGHTLSELRIAIAAAEQQAADDDEPVTLNWFNAEFNGHIQLSESRFIMMRQLKIVLCDEGGEIIIDIKTRGQLRQLVELLKGE